MARFLRVEVFAEDGAAARYIVFVFGVEDACQKGLERVDCCVLLVVITLVGGIVHTPQQECLVLLKDDQVLELSRRDDFFRGRIIRVRIVSRLLATLGHIGLTIIWPCSLAHCCLSVLLLLHRVCDFDLEILAGTCRWVSIYLLQVGFEQELHFTRHLTTNTTFEISPRT